MKALNEHGKKKNGTHIRQLAHKLSLMNFNDAFCKVICLEKSRSSLVFSIGCALCSLLAATYSDYFCHDRRIHNWVILTKYGFQYRTRIYTNDVTDMLCSDDLRTYSYAVAHFLVHRINSSETNMGGVSSHG